MSEIIETVFDAGDIRSCRKFVMTDERKVVVEVIDFGARIVAIKTPDKNGHFEDIVLGFRGIHQYVNSFDKCFGASLGHSDKPTSISRPELDLLGLSKRKWEAQIVNRSTVKMWCTVQMNQEENFIKIDVEAYFTLSRNGYNTSQLVIEFKAKPSRLLSIPLSISSNNYFNLAGHASGEEGLARHNLRLYADEVFEEGRMFDVHGTPYDLRHFENVGKSLSQLVAPKQSFKNLFVIENSKHGTAMRSAAYLLDNTTGRFLEVSCDYPTVYMTTLARHMSLMNKVQSAYHKNSGISFAPLSYSGFLNSPKEYVSDVYKQTISYMFGVIHY